MTDGDGWCKEPSEHMIPTFSFCLVRSAPGTVNFADGSLCVRPKVLVLDL
jgi:hypothetical protein